jgi:hypothetical protein
MLSLNVISIVVVTGTPVAPAIGIVDNTIGDVSSTIVVNVALEYTLRFQDDVAVIVVISVSPSSAVAGTVIFTITYTFESDVRFPTSGIPSPSVSVNNVSPSDSYKFTSQPKEDVFVRSIVSLKA